MDSQVLEVMGLDNEYKLFIGGKWVPASDGGKFTAYCAATGEKLAECAEATEADAVALAKDVSVECFAPLTPRKVTEEDARALLEKVFS